MFADALDNKDAPYLTVLGASAHILSRKTALAAKQNIAFDSASTPLCDGPYTALKRVD
jgi:hypothetical protein